ncbi:MAG: AraC family transcriptional regulator [Chitinophagaceae bacterium]|nr:AraC family transcriptional regulator [Chitinophagaceae bacterium]
MSDVPLFKLSLFRDEWNKDENYLYFEWEGNSLVVDKPHRHDFYMILLLQTSNGVHTIDEVPHPTSGWQIHFLFPGQVHHWSLSADTIAHQLMISHKTFEMISLALRFNEVAYKKYPVLQLQQHEYLHLVHEFRSIKDELLARPILWEMIYNRTRLIALFASRKLEDTMRKENTFGISPVLLEYINLLDLHFKKHRALHFYSSKLHITSNYLNMLCMKHFKKTATSVIRERIIVEAKRQLELSDRSVKEVAFDLGFKDLANFSKFFKSNTNYSPRAFKDINNV